MLILSSFAILYSKSKLKKKSFFLIWLLVFSSQILFAQVSKETDSIIGVINNKQQTATLLSKENKNSEAIDQLLNAIEIYNIKQVNNTNLLFGLYVNIADLYGLNRDLENSKIFIEKAKEISGNKDISPYNLANFYLSLGANNYDDQKFEKALGFFTKTHEIVQIKKQQIINEIGKKSFLIFKANTLEWFVSAYLKLDNETKLLEAYNRLVRFSNQHSETKYYVALASFKVGRYYQQKSAEIIIKPTKTKAAEKAAYYFKLAAKEGDKNLQLYSYICSGFTLLEVKEYKKIPVIITKLEEFTDLNKFQQLNIHEIASRYYSETGKIDKLIEQANKGLTLLNNKEIDINVLNFNPNDFSPIKQLKYPVLLHQFGIFLEESNDPRLIKTSTSLFKICLTQFADRLDRQPFNNMLVVYKNIKVRILNYLNKEKPSLTEKQKMISEMEQIETQSSFNKLLTSRALSTVKTSLDSLFQKEGDIRSEITKLKQNASENDSLIKQDIFNLELQLSDIYKNIKNENPSINDLANKTFLIDELKLNDVTTIFKFSVVRNKVFRIKITNNDIETKHIGNYETLEKHVNTFLPMLKNPNSIKKLNTQGEELYSFLFNNTLLSENTIIIAEEILRYIPFELLKKGNNYLIQETTISYANGLSYLTSLNYKKAQHSQNVSFFVPSYSSQVLSEDQIAVRGDEYSLKGAKEEVNVLSKLTNGTIFSNKEASKRSFLSLKNDYSVIHMAGHAFLNDKDPELSSLIFSDTDEDNKLFISELYGFKSNANLAVLSACNTGIGGYKSGKGVVSLSQAFMYSGIPSTISSLWSAPDNSTKEIMISFYKHLKEGKTKSKALQLSKTEYLQNTTNEKLRHPYYWAPFVIYGDDSPIEFIETSHQYYYWASAIIILVILIFTALRNKKR